MAIWGSKHSDPRDIYKDEEWEMQKNIEEMKRQIMDAQAIGNPYGGAVTGIQGAYMPGLQAMAKMPQKYIRPKGTISIQALQSNPIFKAPVQTLKDLWRAKFQDNWVDQHKLEEEHNFMVQCIVRVEPDAFDQWKVVDEDNGYTVLAIRLKDDANPPE